MNYGWGDRHTHTHTHTQTNAQTDRHINTMIRPGLRAGPSENYRIAFAVFLTSVLYEHVFVKTQFNKKQPTPLAALWKHRNGRSWDVGN